MADGAGAAGGSVLVSEGALPLPLPMPMFMGNYEGSSDRWARRGEVGDSGWGDLSTIGRGPLPWGQGVPPCTVK